MSALQNPAVFIKFTDPDSRVYPEADTPRFAARSLYDLPYIGDAQRVHLMDLFLPKSRRQKRPVILHLHGGAWTFGSREQTRGYCRFLASKGFAALTADFTNAEGADLATQVRDVLAAMQWIRSNASIYGLDPNAVFLSGESTGAHLALLAYLVGRDDTLRLVYGATALPVNVRAFGLSSPVADLHFFTDSVLPPQKALRTKLFGENYADCPLRYCSSIAEVLRVQTPLPPVWLVSSEEDFLCDQSTQLHHVLNRRNADNQFRFFPAGKQQPLSHGFSVLQPSLPESLAANDEMLALFRAQL